MSSWASKTPARSDARGPLTSSTRSLPGVGASRQNLLKDLGIETIGDLLVSCPRRYLDRQYISRIADLAPGETQTVVASIDRTEIKYAGGRRLLIAHVGDASGKLTCVWFNMPYLKHVLARGATFVFSGRVQADRFGRSMIHPEYEKAEAELLHAGRIVPVYRTRPGMSQKQMRTLVRHALKLHLDDVVDYLPADVRQSVGLMPLRRSISEVHFPSDAGSAEAARRRLAFDEMLVLQTLFALSRKTTREAGTEAASRGESVERFLSHLPFRLTRDQISALDDILADMSGTYPMRRLLQGDVGCGKTVVASLAAAAACAGGGQAALMCPTEILAEQHFATTQRFLRPLGLSVGLLSGSLAGHAKDATLAGLKSGAISLVVGTHALVGERLRFKNLRLIIVDEEQRFGVLQRTGLLAKAPGAALLVVAATPIPRTLALTAYGDLDATMIREMPPGRGVHRSHLVGQERRALVLKQVADKISHGMQGFCVCPAIEDSDAGLVDVGSVAKEMTSLLAPGRKAEILTGETPRDRRARIIAEFRANRIGLIVATSVVEVGMDIPSATLLVVNQAERFGLSQLHQMRGRVARTDAESFSYFILSDSASSEARERVALLERTFDGFEIAEQDLVLRGPGDVVGTRQHGVPDLRFARLPEDTDLMLKARDEAFKRVLARERPEAWQAWMNAVRGRSQGEGSVIL